MNFITTVDRRNMKIYFSILVLSIISLTPTLAKASLWDDLWHTRDQQANQAYQNKEYEKAAELFEDSQWQGASSYQQGDFDSATLQFSKFDDVESKYNNANSLAKAQQFEQAIEHYDQVLKESPNHEDALFNKKIVEELLKQQQEKQEQQDQDKQDQDKQDQDKQESDSESDSQSDSEQDSEQSEQEKSEQQESDKQSDQESEQQSEEQQAQLAEDQRDQNEKDQALENWLEKIPDDPGGLLRRKMYREYQRRGRQQKEKKIW